MIKKVLKNKPVILSLALLLIVAVFFCGNDNALGQHNTSNSVECLQVFSNIIAPSKDNNALRAISVLIFAFIFAGLFQNTPKITNEDNKIANFDFRQIWQFLYKLFDPILQALRRGILNPQIYDSVFATI